MADRSVLKKNAYGFYRVNPLPTEEELARHYRETYYQDTASDTYAQVYEPEELAYLRGRMEEKAYMIGQITPLHSMDGTGRSLLDIGCGEGWVLAYFHEHGWQVEGFDFSSYGIEHQNKAMLPYFTQGDVFELCDRRIDEGQTYDVLNMDNVLEHVTDPEAILKKCAGLLKTGGLLCVRVPNDCNPLQDYLREQHLVTREKWISPLEHLSYFNKDGLTALAEACGLRTRKVLGVDMIELFKLNPDTNYDDHPEIGHGCHVARRHWEKLTRGISMEKKLRLCEALGDMHLGREIVAVFEK